MNQKFLLSVFAALAAFSPMSVLAGGAGDDDGTPGTAVVSAAEEEVWWNSLTTARQAKLTSLFDPEWFDEQSTETQIAYCYVAQALYDFLETPGRDSRPDDSYTGFAPLLLRASFHAAGT